MSENPIISAPVSAPSSANDAVFVSAELREVLAATHAAAEQIVDLREIRAQEVGIRALFRIGNLLYWFRSDATEEEVARFAAIIAAMNEGRKRLGEAANDPAISEKAA